METLIPQKRYLLVEGELDSGYRSELFDNLNKDSHEILQVVKVEDALNAASILNPKIVVIDLDSALRATGIDLVDHIRNRFPAIYVFLVSSNPLPGLERMGNLFPIASRVYWVSLDLNSQLDLAAEIERIVTQGSQINESIKNLIISSDSHTNKLSLQQRAILTLVSNGASNRAIAESLGLSVKAVEHQISVSAKAIGIPSDHSEFNQRVLMAREYLVRFGGKH